MNDPTKEIETTSWSAAQKWIIEWRKRPSDGLFFEEMELTPEDFIEDLLPKNYERYMMKSTNDNYIKDIKYKLAAYIRKKISKEILRLTRKSDAL